MLGSLSITVIIPTYNGAHKVVQALDSLLIQSCKPDEVIVVIDGSTDNTKVAIEEKNYQFSSFKIIEQANGGRAKVRNTGAAKATSELLLFMDDDMIAPVNWIENHIKHHILNINTLLTGKLEDPNEGKGDDFLEFKSWLNKRWNIGLNNLEDSVNTILKYPYVSANNFSIQATLFKKLEGFDERLNDAEDYDLAVRAFEKGFKLYSSNEAFAWHNDTANCKKYIKRLREYQDAQNKLVILKPDIYKNNHRFAVVYPTGIKKIIFKLFSHDFWASAIDEKYFTFLPKNIRYKFYDIVVTSQGVYNINNK